MTVVASPLDATIPVGDDTINGFWHCFGVNGSVKVDRKQASAMLDASGTSLLPINTNTGRPLIGHGVITWDSFKDEAESRKLVPCLNINLRTTAADAILTAETMADKTGITLLKLEVLDVGNESYSDDEACVAATAVLSERGYTVMPLISTNYHAARTLGDLDVPLIRVMGSPIGSGKGVQDPRIVQDICTFTGKPIVLDGGVGRIAHARHALELGCSGVLVNSCLFAGDAPDPVGKLKKFRQALA